MLAESYSDLISRNHRRDFTTRCAIFSESDDSPPEAIDTGSTIDLSVQARNIVQRQIEQRDFGVTVTHIAYGETQTDLKVGWRLVETFVKDSAGNWDAVTDGRTWLIEAFERIHELAGVRTDQVEISLHTMSPTDKVGTRA